MSGLLARHGRLLAVAVAVTLSTLLLSLSLSRSLWSAAVIIAPDGMAVWTGEPSWLPACPESGANQRTAYAVPFFGSGSAHLVAVCNPRARRARTHLADARA